MCTTCASISIHMTTAPIVVAFLVKTLARFRIARALRHLTIEDVIKHVVDRALEYRSRNIARSHAVTYAPISWRGRKRRGGGGGSRPAGEAPAGGGGGMKSDAPHGMFFKGYNCGRAVENLVFE